MTTISRGKTEVNLALLKHIITMMIIARRLQRERATLIRQIQIIKTFGLIYECRREIIPDTGIPIANSLNMNIIDTLRQGRRERVLRNTGKDGSITIAHPMNAQIKTLSRGLPLQFSRLPENRRFHISGATAVISG